MGTQKLLLLVLGVILVGAAIIVGLNLSQAYAAEKSRDELISRIHVISNMATAYFKKSAEQSGRGSFNGFEVDSDLLGNRTEIGRIAVTVQANQNRIVINTRGTEVGYDGIRQTIVRGILTASGLTITITN